METAGTDGAEGSGKSCGRGVCGKKGIVVVTLLLVGIVVGAVACGGKQCGAKSAAPVATPESPAAPSGDK